MFRSMILTCSRQCVERFGLLFILLGVLSLATPVAFAETSPAATYLDAQSLIREGHWAEAAIALRKAIDEQPRLFPARLQLVSALIRLDRRTEAMADLNRWIAQENENHKEELIERVQVLSRLFYNRETEQAYLDGVSLLQAFRLSDARPKFLQALEKEKDNVEILLRLGQLSVLERDYDSAVERLKLAAQLNAYQPQVHLWLGRALLRRGEVATGLTELEAAIKNLPESELAAVSYGEALAAAGQTDQAKNFLENDVLNHPNRAQSICALVRVRLESTATPLGTLKESKELIQTLRKNLNEITKKTVRETEGELGIRAYKAEDISEETQLLEQQIETRLERAEPN